MTGNSRSGVRPKQLDERAALDPKDKPTRPRGLKAHALRLWNTTIAEGEHLRKSDTDLAATCCGLYQLLKECEECLRTQPADREMSLMYRGYHGAWLRNMAALSLDPLGRLRTGKTTRRKKPGENAPEVRFFGGKKTG